MDTLQIEAEVGQQVGLVNRRDAAYVACFVGPDGRDGQVTAARFVQANAAANILSALGIQAVRIWSNLTHDWT
ncbi:hypothetical protein QU487_06585 [Crenobacter sp. SG2305]|uniref:hypothetical protein n=1 Tax=Crenobacter oryzisoli TaxID=3056844 RepID=UPI0025AAC5E7|nr:hypothetical protein [Crenobacter sp. SG2305]MDN0082420.1 hypothetical protein [Crenobacter sp. SG2305]